MKESNSIGKDFIRHIRNGIAHGQTKIIKRENTLYIEILDFKDKDKSLDKQTGYIYIPLSYVVDIYKIYSEIQKSINNTKKSARKEQRRKKRRR